MNKLDNWLSDTKSKEEKDESTFTWLVCGITLVCLICPPMIIVVLLIMFAAGATGDHDS